MTIVLHIPWQAADRVAYTMQAVVSSVMYSESDEYIYTVQVILLYILQQTSL